MITSASNPKIKHARSLQQRKGRERHQQFLIEGVKLIADAERAGIQPAFLFATPAFMQSATGGQLAERWPSRCEVVTDAVFKTLNDTVTPQGIVAVAPFPQLRAQTRDFVLIVDRVRDPGNIGALLRSAAAAGVSETLVSVGSADVFSPKVVRAAMGAHFRLPIQPDLTWVELAERVQGMSVLLADTQGALAYEVWDWRKPTALIVGGEAEGASAEARALATQSVRIPMHADTESLNAAVAASVILFEAARQRRL